MNSPYDINEFLRLTDIASFSLAFGLIGYALAGTFGQGFFSDEFLGYFGLGGAILFLRLGIILDKHLGNRRLKK